jgi:hypothetical protein
MMSKFLKNPIAFGIIAVTTSTIISYLMLTSYLKLLYDSLRTHIELIDTVIINRITDNFQSLSVFLFIFLISYLYTAFLYRKDMNLFFKHRAVLIAVGFNIIYALAYHSFNYQNILARFHLPNAASRASEIPLAILFIIILYCLYYALITAGNKLASLSIHNKENK